MDTEEDASPLRVRHQTSAEFHRTFPGLRTSLSAAWSKAANLVIRVTAKMVYSGLYVIDWMTSSCARSYKFLWTIRTNYSEALFRSVQLQAEFRLFLFQKHNRENITTQINSALAAYRSDASWFMLCLFARLCLMPSSCLIIYRPVDAEMEKDLLRAVRGTLLQLLHLLVHVLHFHPQCSSVLLSCHRPFTRQIKKIAVNNRSLVVLIVENENRHFTLPIVSGTTRGSGGRIQWMEPMP